MLRVFGVKDQKQTLPSLRDASDRMSRRSGMVDEKIKRLDTELSKCREQIRKMRPGPAREAARARAMRVLKQKRGYEGQRDTLDGQSFRLEQVAFAVEDIIDSQQTIPGVTAMLFVGGTITCSTQGQICLSGMAVHWVCIEHRGNNKGGFPIYHGLNMDVQCNASFFYSDDCYP